MFSADEHVDYLLRESDPSGHGVVFEGPLAVWREQFPGMQFETSGDGPEVAADDLDKLGPGDIPALVA